jgi:hypothetical protein
MNSADPGKPVILSPIPFAPVAPSLLHEKQFLILLQKKKHRTSSEKQTKSTVKNPLQLH